MRLIVMMAALALSGCATLETAGERVCANQVLLRQAIELALLNAYTFTDPVARERTVRTLNAALAGLAACPATPSGPSARSRSHRSE